MYAIPNTHLIQTCCKTVVRFPLEEPGEKLFGQLALSGLRRVFHRVPEQSVFLAQFHALLPPIVALVQVGGDASELRQLVLLQTLGQADVVKVVERIDRRSQTLMETKKCYFELML